MISEVVMGRFEQVLVFFAGVASGTVVTLALSFRREAVEKQLWGIEEQEWLRLAV